MELAARRPWSVAGRLAAGMAGAFVLLLALQAGLSWIRWSGWVGLRAQRSLESALLVDPFQPRCILWNWSSAISSLRNLHSVQTQFRDEARLDEDRDGRGEFGSFAELSGAAPLRGAERLATPPLSGAFRRASAAGEVSRAGYLFRIRLPARGGGALGGGPTGVPAGAADSDAAETTWCAYAWPAMYDRSGLATFCVTADGTIWRTEDARYDGPGAGPAPGAAFPSGGLGAIGGASAEPSPTKGEHVGQDGNVWRRVN